MTVERPSVERRVLKAIKADPKRVPFVLGSGGSGRTSLLLHLRQTIGAERCQYIDVEQAATTPEGFLRALTINSPFRRPGQPSPSENGLSARDAFQASLAFLDSAQTNSGNSALFLLDEVLELRTFDSFPGLRTVLPELLRTLQGSRNRFVMSTRYVSRAHRLLRNASPEYEVIHVPPLSSAEIADKLSPEYAPQDAHALTELAQAVQVLTDGRPGYVQILDDAMRGMAGRVGDDPVAALTAQMSRGAPLWERCRFYFELRLHRARGYGALKAILLVLADQEPLTLTEIAQRLQRTPGSTKDYLSWLEDVDLISARQKRYGFVDPLLRLWVQIHCRSEPFDEEQLARQVQQFAHEVLPEVEPVPDVEPALATSDNGADRTWSGVEID